jgi:hypothetical protein
MQISDVQILDSRYADESCGLYRLEEIAFKKRRHFERGTRRNNLLSVAKNLLRYA